MDKNTENTKKDSLKGKILLFIIGVLVGAIISTASFLVYANTLGVNTNSNDASSRQMPGGGTPPEMPSGENGQSQPPEMPSDSNASQENN